MLKICKVFILFVFCSISAQKALPFEHLILGEVTDFFADDYGNIYIYKNKDFSFRKYDSLGKEKGKLMLTLPFKIQTVQNPLNIPSFSENAQELRFFDQNLNELQTINFRQKFGFIKLAFVEDLQETWLLDESTKQLIQYDFREDRKLNSFSFNVNLEKAIDLLVYEKKVYFLENDRLSIYNLHSEKIAEFPLENARKLRRENGRILVIEKNTIQEVDGDNLKTIFTAENSQIVDKNSLAYFVIRDNNLYLYPIEKEFSFK